MLPAVIVWEGLVVVVVGVGEAVLWEVVIGDVFAVEVFVGRVSVGEVFVVGVAVDAVDVVVSFGVVVEVVFEFIETVGNTPCNFITMSPWQHSEKRKFRKPSREAKELCYVTYTFLKASLNLYHKVFHPAPMRIHWTQVVHSQHSSHIQTKP